LFPILLKLMRNAMREVGALLVVLVLVVALLVVSGALLSSS
jgi:hypothetical protein